MNENIVKIIPIFGLPEFKKNDNLIQILDVAFSDIKEKFMENDVLVITQKIISKIEDRAIDLEVNDISEVLKNESTEILRKRGETVIARTKHGFICANAGIGMVTSIVSSITGIPVRRDVAMTGEVTLTGQVLPIGGLKEKLLAAHRAGIKEVLIPKENEKDLVDMPKKIIDDIKITPVEFADQVLKVALTKELKRTEWVEVDISKKDDKSQASIQ